MQDAAAVLALADRVEAQYVAVRRELDRVLNLQLRLSGVLATESWQGLARNAFDSELALLRTTLATVATELGSAAQNSSRARETLLGRVE